MLDTAILDRAFAALPAAIREAHPSIALVLGSGWNRTLDGLRILAECPYDALPGLGKASVPGHDGRVVLFERPAPPSPQSPTPSPQTALAFCGRRHWYECQQWEPTVFPADFCRRLAIPRLLLTNAAGGVNPSYHPGDIILVRDHLRLNYLNPLLGPHNPLYGPRFPDQSHVYSEDFRADLRHAAESAGVPLAEGVYAFSCGPTFETPAEVRAYGILGADLVGMSTVPEAIVATACGIEVGALSLVTNMAAGLGAAALSHEEVVETARVSTERMVALLTAFLSQMPSN